MMLRFPEAGEDLSDAFNNALSRGALSDSPKSNLFWGLHDLMASTVENDEISADWFTQRNTDAFIEVPRTGD